MSGILQSAVAAVLTAAAIGGLTWMAGRARSHAAGQAGRRISPNRGVMGAVAAGCFALGGFALYAAAFHGGGAPALYVGLPFVAFGALMLTSLSPRMDVIWDAERMEGPASYGMPPFGPRRAAMAFEDIVEVGVDAMGSLYARDGAGQKLRWNQYYSGYHELADHIALVRPDLIEADG